MARRPHVKGRRAGSDQAVGEAGTDLPALPDPCPPVACYTPACPILPGRSRQVARPPGRVSQCCARVARERKGQLARLSKDDLIDMQGTVVAVHSGGLYRVQCDAGHEVLAQLSGRMRRFRIKVVPGDRVTVGVSPYDPVRGIITFRAR